MEKLCSQEYPQQESDPAAEILTILFIIHAAIVIKCDPIIACVAKPARGIFKIALALIFYHI